MGGKMLKGSYIKSQKLLLAIPKELQQLLSGMAIDKDL
jgi:hypothetical protein